MALYWFLDQVSLQTQSSLITKEAGWLLHNQNPEVEMGMSFPSILPNNSLPVRVCFSSLSSIGLEILVPREEIFPPGKTTTVLLNWKVSLPSGLSGLFTLLSQQTEKKSDGCND